MQWKGLLQIQTGFSFSDLLKLYSLSLFIVLPIDGGNAVIDRPGQTTSGKSLKCSIQGCPKVILSSDILFTSSSHLFQYLKFYKSVYNNFLCT